MHFHIAHKLTYSSWRGMLDRCRNPNHISYKHYGGRGIKVCKRWHKFRNFLFDMGERPGRNYQIERKNTDGNYKPSNCKWATRSEQCFNRRNIGRYSGLTIDGVTKTLREWGRTASISHVAIRNRLRSGMSAKEAVFSRKHRIKFSDDDVQKIHELTSRGLSRVNIARRLNADPSTVSRIARGLSR